MPSFNKVFLMGNLTRDPELRHIPSGSAVCELGLACNRRYTNARGEPQEDVTFINVTVWGKQAESTGKFLQKGAPVFIEGRLQLDQWDDRETGKKRSSLKVVGERIQFLSGGSNPQENNNSQNFNNNMQGGSNYNANSNMNSGTNYKANSNMNSGTNYKANNNMNNETNYSQPAPPTPSPSPQVPPQENANANIQSENQTHSAPPNDVLDNEYEPEDDIPF